MRIKSFFTIFKVATMAMVMVTITESAFAGGTVAINDIKSIDFGGSIRTELNKIEDAAPSGEDDSFDFNIHSFRMYLKAKMTDTIKFGVQTEIDGNGNMLMLDSYADIKLSDNVTLLAGRFIPPSDRSNLSGSYNMPSWDYTSVASKYPGKKGGRDDGIAVWGELSGGTYVYSIGLFEGYDGSPNVKDSPMLASRFAINFWDSEGYLTRSTYYGAKKILTLGITAMNQKEALGDPAEPSDFVAYNVDFMLESPLPGGGVGTVEAAYYNYAKNGGDTSAKQGVSYLISLSYLFANKIGPGKLQPNIRFQSFEPDGEGLDSTERFDIGVTSVIDGHNARIGLYYGNLDSGDEGTKIIKLGMQLKI